MDREIHAAKGLVANRHECHIRLRGLLLGLKIFSFCAPLNLSFCPLPTLQIEVLLPFSEGALLDAIHSAGSVTESPEFTDAGMYIITQVILQKYSFVHLYMCEELLLHACIREAGAWNCPIFGLAAVHLLPLCLFTHQLSSFGCCVHGLTPCLMCVQACMYVPECHPPWQGGFSSGASYPLSLQQ